MLIGSIDVGSSTVRLLAAETEKGRIKRQVLNLREMTRLGEGLDEGGRLSPGARGRTLEVLKEFSEKLKKAGVEHVSAVATEALRKASDSADFVAGVRRETGLELEVLSWEEEARRTLLGIMSGTAGLNIEGWKLLIDIGGGSTELITTFDWKSCTMRSLPIGAVSLYERFLLNDPPSGIEMSELLTYCFGIIGKVEIRPEGKAPVLIGTAGTITTLAAVDLNLEEYDPAKVTGHVLTRDMVDNILARLIGLSRENRKLVMGLEPGREDIIVSGTLLLGALMDAAGADSIIACDSGLREGNLLDFMGKQGI